MSLAHQIRDFIEQRCLTPAREQGRASVTVKAADVHRQMGLQNRLPAVCSAMRSGGLLDRGGVTVEKWEGPSQGSAVVTYSLVHAPSSGSGDARQSSVMVSAASWSPETPFERKAIESTIPHSAGVYRILQQDEYPRYQGRTRILKIGMSETSLQQEILNHLSVHTAANRLERLRQAGSIVTVSHVVLTRDLASPEENSLLRAFEDEHWELPLLNAKRGYERGADAHYRG